MEAVILAAGEGERMRPLSVTRPKVMIPVANKPLLEHLMLNFRTAGISEFVFVVGYREDVVRDYFGDGESWGTNIRYVRQEEQRGTADALWCVRGMVGERFLLANGDAVPGIDDLCRIVESEGLSVGVAEVPNAKGLGVVEVADGRIVRIHEKVAKPTTNLANAGVYLLTTDIFQAVEETGQSTRGEYEIVDSLHWLIDRGFSIKYDVFDTWLHLTHPWEILSANETLLSGLEPSNDAHVESNATLHGAVSIGTGTTIKSGSYIVGPVIIGSHCDIGPNCFIRPATAIGDHCHIGAAVEIKNSLIMKNSKVPHHNYVGDSIIGEDCNLGSGTKIANLRFDKKDIKIRGRSTGRRKLGAILGDGVQTGINASINAGSIISPGVFIRPGAVASGEISKDSRVH
ncbi:MAG: bifunctional sugar-1-phosphate nucleotidylyltransferase/acetyltransferase [Chloroflexota bacterium]|nr:bifunctional sugar-1-phosphate nucleotidylyltransferase/acetyltransferase [Chloroflexota bacterium]